jgi:hypothetical protein
MPIYLSLKFSSVFPLPTDHGDAAPLLAGKRGMRKISSSRRYIPAGIETFRVGKANYAALGKRPRWLLDLKSPHRVEY